MEHRFCERCGKVLIIEEKLIGYDYKTGKPLLQFIFKCLFKRFYNSHTKYRVRIDSVGVYEIYGGSCGRAGEIWYKEQK